MEDIHFLPYFGSKIALWPPWEGAQEVFIPENIFPQTMPIILTHNMTYLVIFVSGMHFVLELPLVLFPIKKNSSVMMAPRGNGCFCGGFPFKNHLLAYPEMKKS